MNRALIPNADPPVVTWSAFGRYALRARIAEGGMASVYLAQIAATDTFKKWVAIKAMHPEFAADKRYVAMFLDEARIAAQLDHPNVCSVIDFGEVDGTYFMAMEYLHGEPLNAVAARARAGTGMPLALGARVVCDAARGLHAAHELRGPDGRPCEVVHRDVSPQNIFVLYDGVAKVVDFGVAQYRNRGSEHTETGVLKGKIAYMAPEQMRAQTIDRRADIFALGVVLWEITLSRRLFKRETEVDTMMAVLNEGVPRPSSLVADYPAELEAIVMRALARAPDGRYATAGELARDLDLFLARAGTPSGAPQVAEFMIAQFADRMEIRTGLLRHDGGTLHHGLPVAIGTAPLDPALAAREGQATQPVRRARSDARLQYVTMTAMAAALAAIGVTWVGRVMAPGASREPASHAAARAPSSAALAGEAVTRGAIWPVLPADNTASSTPAAALPAAVAEASLTTEARRAARRALQALHPRPVAEEDEGIGPPGRLNLVAVPSATVYEGDAVLGSTPLVRLALAPGRHVLRLVSRDGLRQRRIVVHIRPGETHVDSVRFP